MEEAGCAGPKELSQVTFSLGLKTKQNKTKNPEVPQAGEIGKEAVTSYFQVCRKAFFLNVNIH